MRGQASLPGRILALARRPDVAEMGLAVANQILVSGATFVIGIAAARLLGLEQFGRYTIILILAALMQGFQNSFLLMPMMTLAGLKGGRTAHYYRGLMTWNGVLSGAAGAVVALIVAVAFGLRDGTAPAHMALAAGAYTATQNYLFSVRRILYARRVAWQTLALDVTRFALFAAAVALAWSRRGGVGLELLLWSLAGSALIASAPFTWLLGAARLRIRLLAGIWSRHWPFARWLLPMTIVTFVQEQAITLSLGFFLSDEAVGGLRAGQYLLGATHFVMMAMENFVPGGAARALSQGGKSALRRFLVGMLVAFGIPTGVLIGLLALFAGPALTLAFGEGYARFAPLLQIFALSYVCIFVRDIWSQYFRAIERTDVIFRAFVASCIVAGILVVPALLWLGVTGAALVILSTNLVSMLFVGAAAWRDRQSKTAPLIPD